MFPLFIDLRDTVAEFNLTRQQAEGILNYCVKEVTAEFARNWAEEAKRGLNSTRQQFLNSLVVVDQGKMRGAVMLVGALPNMLEDGASAFDMKDGFARSAKRKQFVRKDGSTGWYLTIPFRWGSAGALGESSVFSARLPGEVYKVAKSQATTTPIKGGSRSQGLRPTDLPTGFQMPGTRAGVSSLVPNPRTFDEYTHKTSVYAGLTKIQDNTTGQSRYMSFRRVSDKSDPNAFVSSGIVAGKFAEKAMSATNIPTIVDRSLDTMLARFGF